jgi:uncharacterized protein (DUF1684 family)
MLALACRNRPPDARDYVASIERERVTKDAAFATGPDSPIPGADRARLLPLGYFPIDPEYNVAAALEPSVDTLELEMPTSAGTRRQMRRVGRLAFSLKGLPLRLTAFVEVGSVNTSRLFVPFTDLTTGTETYAGGRYLDLDRNATGIYSVDFNRAYHPFCCYNPTYDCPYPPAENRLQLPIRAGERLRRPEP